MLAAAALAWSLLRCGEHGCQCPKRLAVCPGALVLVHAVVLARLAHGHALDIDVIGNVALLLRKRVDECDQTGVVVVYLGLFGGAGSGVRRVVGVVLFCQVVQGDDMAGEFGLVLEGGRGSVAAAWPAYRSGFFDVLAEGVVDLEEAALAERGLGRIVSLRHDGANQADRRHGGQVVEVEVRAGPLLGKPDGERQVAECKAVSVRLGSGFHAGVAGLLLLEVEEVGGSCQAEQGGRHWGLPWLVRARWAVASIGAKIIGCKGNWFRKQAGGRCAAGRPGRGAWGCAGRVLHDRRQGRAAGAAGAAAAAAHHAPRLHDRRDAALAGLEAGHDVLVELGLAVGRGLDHGDGPVLHVREGGRVIEPDGRFYRIRLSDKVHDFAHV